MTYAKDLKYPVEFLLPGSDRILVASRMERSREHVPLILLDDILLSIVHGSAVVALIGGLVDAYVPELAHALSRPIASVTVSLRSSDSIPLNPRSSALHTCAQDDPRST